MLDNHLEKIQVNLNQQKLPYLERTPQPNASNELYKEQVGRVWDQNPNADYRTDQREHDPDNPLPKRAKIISDQKHINDA